MDQNTVQKDPNLWTFFKYATKKSKFMDQIQYKKVHIFLTFFAYPIKRSKFMDQNGPLFHHFFHIRYKRTNIRYKKVHNYEPFSTTLQNVLNFRQINLMKRSTIMDFFWKTVEKGPVSWTFFDI